MLELADRRPATADATEHAVRDAFARGAIAAPHGHDAVWRHPTGRPLLRGWIHAAAFVAALVFAVLLMPHVAYLPVLQRAALALYCASLVALYAISAAFHLGPWRGRTYRRLRLLDHSGIFLAIAGAYTPFVGALPDAHVCAALLVAIWGAAGVGIAAKLRWPAMVRATSTALYVALGGAMGCAAAYAFPTVVPRIPPLIALLLPLGALVHILGAAVYARRAPDLWPRVFGHHELFHLLVVLGNAAVSVPVVLLVVR